MLQDFSGRTHAMPEQVTTADAFAWSYGTGLSGRQPSSELYCNARYGRAAQPAPWFPRTSLSGSEFGLGGDGGELNSPSRGRTTGIYYKLSRAFDLASRTPLRRACERHYRWS